MFHRGKEIDSGYDLEWLKRMCVTILRGTIGKARELHADELGNFVIQNEAQVGIFNYDYEISDSDEFYVEEDEEVGEG
jgi:hypothetical protein